MKILLLFLAIFTTLITGSAQAEPILINGAGATFPYPLYTKWFSEYQKIDPNIQLNYQSIGSGGGIRQFSEKTIDFGATDVPMTDEQITKAGAPVLHIPTVMGAVVLTYNLPGIAASLKLGPEVIANIFLGTIKNWNDPAIKKLNPDIPLPELAIAVVRRSDGSGTTGIFTDYLSKISPEWKAKVGQGASVNWPVGLGGKGNEGVTGLVKQTPGAIGYVELIYAENTKLSYAAIQNKAGQFVTPSMKTVSSAAAGSLKTMPDDFRISITNAEGKSSYPISGFTYLLVYKNMLGDKGVKFVKFLNWALADGQKFAEPLSYAPLPKELVSKVQNKVKTIVTR